VIVPTHRPERAHPHQIECLACGGARVPARNDPRQEDGCPRCGYLGWALSAELDEQTRRRIRDRALALR
jgi:hypothetical protein